MIGPAAILLACASSGGDAWSSGLDHLDATTTWAELRGYQTWFVQNEPWVGVQPNSSNHDEEAYARIWLNPQADGRVGSTLPDGSIFVLEAFPGRGGEASWIGVMRKVEGYSATTGDWFWAAHTPSGGVLEAGAVSRCAGCHVQGADYVRSALRDPRG